ncbi:NAD(P)-binding protein, partial [Aureobasidium melanogenum]
MSKSLIFITGATGFIGAEVVQQALEAGYRVRLSIRRPEQADTLKNRYAEYASEIETVVIPDITQREPFEKVLDDVEYIIHIASPLPGQGKDLKQDFIKPAVDGTEAILYAALKFPRIKSVVITSSGIALLPVDDDMLNNKTFNENTGEIHPVNVDVEVPDSPEGQQLMYRISKILAHQAGRNFLSREKPSYKLFTTHPTLVIGESRIQSSAEQIDFVNGMLWTFIHHGLPNPNFLPSIWVDIKDVGATHVKALDCNAPSGTEFLVSGPDVTWNEIAEFTQQEYPEISKLEPNYEGPHPRAEALNSGKYLGLEWRPWKQTMRETIEQQLSFQDKASK